MSVDCCLIWFEPLAEGGEFFVVEAVDFVEEDDEAFAFGATHDALGEPLDVFGDVGGIDYPKDDLCALDHFVGALDAHIFNNIRSLANAGSVDETECESVDVDSVFDDVAGSAVDVGHDGAIVANEEVEKGGFTSIGFAYDSHGDAVFDSIAL